MDPETKERIWVIIKTVTFIICLTGFAWNSSINFTQFIGRDTITSQDLQQNEKLALPSFTLCGQSGFKEKVTKYQDLELNNYLTKTLELDEIFISVINDDIYEVNKKSFDLKQLKKVTTLWEITTTYSQFRGRCHTIRYIPKVITTYNSIQFG